jgi:hypothetical protein
MKLNQAITALGLSAPAHALLRFGCAQLTVQRLDPLVNPGVNPSPHLHQIIGGVSILSLRISNRLRLTLEELLCPRYGPCKTRPGSEVHMHELPVCRGLLQLLDCRPVLQSQEWHLQESATKSSGWYGRD